MVITLFPFDLLFRFHLEIKSFLLNVSESESTAFSLDNLDW